MPREPFALPHYTPPMASASSSESQRILLIKPSSPGDIIHALPVLRGLRRRFPHAHIAWLVATPFANLLEADPDISEIIAFDRRHFGRLGRHAGATRDFFRFVRELRARRFDLVIDLQGLFRSGFLAWASGARERVGFRDARELAWLFYNRRISRLPRDMHAADKNMAALERLWDGGASDASGVHRAGATADFRIALTNDDRDCAITLLAEAGIGAAREYAVLVPATRWETKCWPAERYGQLARFLKERYDLPSVLVGGTGDIPLGEQAVAASQPVPRALDHSEPGCPQPGPRSEPAAVNLCGRTTLRELAALVSRARIVITADSTPMHMAAAFDRPLVALFGPTSPTRTGPYGRGESVLGLPLDCSPCYLRRLSQCPHGHKCMSDMTVERVAAAAAEQLQARAQRPAGQTREKIPEKAP